MSKMVKLYTGVGDEGTTNNFAKKKLRKDDTAIEIGGTIDETIVAVERVRLHI